MRVGKVSTRFAGLDGVSLEAAKLVPVIREAGHDLAWFAGELGPEFGPGVEVPAAHFATDENAAIEARAFGTDVKDPDLESEITERAAPLAEELVRFFGEFAIDVAYIHNALSIPMQLPFAVAITEALERTRLPAVAHHHDFGWEKPRFARCAVPGIVERYFPPDLPNLRHVVINTLAQQGLAARTGLAATLLPNVLDFERAPSVDGDGAVFRNAAGLASDAIVLLQPTRVIERKGIESTIRLAARLGPTAVVVVSHAADRDEAYWRRLTELADELSVRLVYYPVAPEPPLGSPWLGDAFAGSDLACFPSIQEGFGNALVEALFFKCPLFVNRYEVYVADIAPMGIRAVEMDGEVTDDVVHAVQALLESEDAQLSMVEHNYEVGRRFMSHRVVRERLLPLIEGI